MEPFWTKDGPWEPDPAVGANLRDVWAIGSRGFNLRLCLVCNNVYSLGELKGQPRVNDKPVCFCGAQDWFRHFALFPVDLPMLCIQASTPEGGVCSECGMPWARVEAIVGWRPVCEHMAAPVPATVLDPMMGAGTTLLAATMLGRRGIGVELGEGYCRLAAGRLERESPKTDVAERRHAIQRPVPETASS